ncbi:MAG TPA: glycosyltransferase family 39 protein, partial [Ktedonobacterales bacterium]|nr:glycosyltransferase family 39 protein [Ktedonobacterales bacterium]
MGAALRTEIVERAAPAVDTGVTHDWRHWPDEPWILFVILGAALIILTGTIQVVHRLDRDEGAFLVIAQAILHGRVPYRDVFDHKSPAIYYLVAAVLALTSRLSLMQQIVALRIVVALANLTTAAGLLLLGKRWKSLEIGALAAALWLIALPLYTGVYAFTEPFATAPTIWAFVVASRKPTWRSSAGAGLLLALASLFKQTVVLAIPAAALLVFCGLLPARRWLPPARALLANAGALLAGLIAPWLMVVGIFFVLGGGPQLFQDVVIANFHYPPDTPSGLVRGVVSDVDLFPFLWLTALLVICLGSWIWLRNRSRAR